MELTIGMQGRAVSHFVEYEATEFLSARFMVGTALFFLGLVINIHSDSILFNLRKPGDTQRYKVRWYCFRITCTY